MLTISSDSAFVTNAQITSTTQGAINTSRLSIRPYIDQDFLQSTQLYGDPATTKYFDHGQPKSEKEVRQVISNCYKASDNGVLGLFSIFDRKGQFIGHIDLMPSDQPGVLELGYILHAPFHGQGLGIEAVQAFLNDYILKLYKNGFKVQGTPIRGIVATAHPDNISSKAILKKVGMKFQTSLTRYGGQPRYQYFLDLAQTGSSTSHLWKPQEYHEHSSAQQDAALSLLRSIALKGTERVLDVGCGSGNVTQKIVEKVPNGSVLGTDISQDMIDFSKNEFSHISNLQFLQQDAQKLSYKNEFEVIFSSFALQWLEDPNAFFSAAYEGLKDHGLLVATIPLGVSDALEQSLAEVTSRPEWAPYFERFSSGWHFQTTDKYKDLLTSNRLKTIEFTLVKQEKAFPSEKAIRSYIKQWLTYLNPIPETSKEAFFNELMTRYFELEPMINGQAFLKFSRVDFVAQK